MVDDSRVYEVPNVLVAILSMIGSLAIILTYACNPRSNWRRLLVFLSICDFVQASFYCFQWIGKNNQEVNAGCVILSLIGFSSEAASCFWTAAVAHHLHKSISSLLAENRGGVEEVDTQLYRRYHYIAWGYPFLITLLVAIKYKDLIYPCSNIDCFGCFIKPIEDGVYWRFAAVYFPQWSTWLYVFVLYLWTYQKKLKQFSNSIWCTTSKE